MRVDFVDEGMRLFAENGFEAAMLNFFETYGAVVTSSVDSCKLPRSIVLSVKT